MKTYVQMFIRYRQTPPPPEFYSSPSVVALQKMESWIKKRGNTSGYTSGGRYQRYDGFITANKGLNLIASLHRKILKRKPFHHTWAWGGGLGGLDPPPRIRNTLARLGASAKF